MDFQNGIDLIVLEKLGVRQYTNNGAAGSVYAYDDPGGGVLIKGYTSSGTLFSALVEDSSGSLSAASFSQADFLFV